MNKRTLRILTALIAVLSIAIVVRAVLYPPPAPPEPVPNDFPVYNGGVLNMASNTSQTIYVTENPVRVPNPICHTVTVAPEGATITSDEGLFNFWIGAPAGRDLFKVNITIDRSQKSEKCKEYWKNRVD